MGEALGTNCVDPGDGRTCRAHLSTIICEGRPSTNVLITPPSKKQFSFSILERVNLLFVIIPALNPLYSWLNGKRRELDA